MTKVTILTPALEINDDFEKTFESIRYLAGLNELNWIVINKSDSKSLKSFAPGCVMISGPDRGLYDALNVGLDFCSTKFFQVLGIGDTLIAENEYRAIQLLSDQSAIYTFPIENGGSRRIAMPEPEGLTKQMSCPHPGVFCPLEATRHLGGFSLTYRIAGDYELLSKLAKSGVKFFNSTTLPVVHFKGGGLSDRHVLESGLENALIKKRIWAYPDRLIVSEMLDFTGLAGC